MKQSTRSPFTRLWMFVAAIVAVVLIPVVATSSASAAVEVGNPGPFTATVNGGSLKIKQTDLDLGTIVPAPTLSGTINADGTFVIPIAGINFPPYILDYDGDPVNIRIQATGPNWTGFIDPDTGGLETDLGDMEINGRLRVKLEGTVGGQSLTDACYIGASGTGDNTNLAPATSGTQPANGAAPEVTGLPYDSETGQATVVNNKYTVPGASGCALLGLGNGILNDALGLPSSTGNNTISLNLETSPKIVPPTSVRYTADPVEGRVPFNVDFDASASVSPVGPITAYKWDFDGDGSVDQTTTEPTTSHNYEVAGVYPTRLTTVANGVETTKHRQTITAKAVITSFTQQAPSSSQSRDPHFEFEANEDGATFECRLDQGAVPGTYQPCTSPVDYTNLVDNDYVLRVRATVDGSTGLPAVAEFRVDNIGPVATITETPPDPVGGNTTDGNVTFESNEPGSTFECRFTPTSSNPSPPEPEFVPCESPAAVSWDAVEGTNTFEVRPTDRAGNVGNITSDTWVVDLTPPTTAITFSPTSPTNAIGGSYAEQCFLGTLVCLISPSYEEVTSAGNTAQRFDFVGNEAGTTYICQWNNTAERPCTSGIQTGTGVAAPGSAVRVSLGTGQRRLGDMIQGNNTFRVWSVDKAGNRQTNPTTYTLVYDTIDPTITALSGPPAWTKISNHTIVFQSNEPVQNLSFQCRFITNTGTGTTSFANNVTGFVPCDPGHLSSTLGWFNTSTVAGLLTDGRKGLQVRATDIAGNTQTTLAEVTATGLTRYWTVDNGLPTVSLAAGGTQQGSFTTSTSATINVTAADTPITFSATAANGIPGQVPLYECSLNNGAFQASVCGSTSPQSPTNTVSLTGLTPGAKSLRVRVTDQATNVSTTLPERNWTVVDASNASVVLTTTPPAVSGSRNVNYTFTPDNGTSQCRIDPTEAQNLADSGWTNCFNGVAAFTGLTDGTHTVQIRSAPGQVPAIHSFAVYANEQSAATQVPSGLPASATASTGDYGFGRVRAGVRYTPANLSSQTIPFTAPANPAFAPGQSTFECRYYITGLTPPAFATCTSPQTVNWSPFDNGQERNFEVRAISSSGIVGPTQAVKWTIDSSKPSVQWGNQGSVNTACASGVVATAGVPGCVAVANSTQPGPRSNLTTTTRFQATTTEGVAPNEGFACQLNTGAVLDPCTSRAPATSPNTVLTAVLNTAARAANNDNIAAGVIQNGSNTFKVWAVDNAGNYSDNPVEYTWIHDNTTPGFAVPAPPASRSNANNVSFNIVANEDIRAVDGFKCRHTAPPTAAPTQGGNPSAWTNCTTVVDPRNATWTGTALAEGLHTIDIKGYDLIDQVNTATTVPSGTDNNVVGRRIQFTIDRTAPVASITAGVAQNGTIGTGTGQFAFNTNEPVAQIASYGCRIDPEDPDDLSSGWSACTSPYSFENLEDGEHKFQVRALDTAGNQGLPLTRTFNVDTTKPEIELSSDLSGPRTNADSAEFTFTVDPANSVSECRLIGPGQEPGDVAWTPACVSPKTYSDLEDGDNTFQVRSTNTLGVLSDISEVSWTVDTAAPDVTIDSGPDDLSNSDSAEFEFSSTDEDATFACQLDEDAPEACDSPKSYASVGEGEHTFSVIATDDVGNSSDAASSTWTVDLTAPETTITAAPDETTEEKFSSFEFESDDVDATFECDLDGEGFGDCESPKTYTVQVGDHQFKVRATDAAGNTGDAAEHNWTVNEPPTCAEGETGTPPDCVPIPTGETRRIVSTLSEGALSVGVLGEIPLPAETLVLDGGLYANGDWIVPKSGVSFQQITQDVAVPGLGSVTVKIALTATGGGAGNLTNGGGDAAFTLPVQAKIEASLGAIPLIGPEADCALRPVTFDLTGTYDEDGDVVTLGSDTVGFPAASAGCGDLGGTVNGLLGLPRNDINLDMVFDLEKSDLEEACPEGQIGTPPNCEDPECPEGQVGTPPNCEDPVCPEGKVGTPPNCEDPVCPEGKVGTPPDCQDPVCPEGKVGTPPNCQDPVCPVGKVGTPPNCVDPPQCEAGETGTPPNCQAPKVAKLTGPKITGKKKVKSGKAVTITYSVKNTGNGAASNVKVCLTLKKAKNLAKGKAKRCKTIKSIGAGKTGTARFTVKTKKVKSNKRLNLSVAASYKGKTVSTSGHVTVLK